MKKICKYCKKEFVTHSNSQIFCKAECRNLFYSKEQFAIKKCLGCGKEYKPNACNQQYCSIECRNRKKPRFCLFCGSKLNGVQKKYCNSKCRNEYLKANKNTVTRKAIRRKKTSLADINKKARSEGLSYGQYMAKYGYERR